MLDCGLHHGRGLGPHVIFLLEGGVLPRFLFSFEIKVRFLRYSRSQNSDFISQKIHVALNLFSGIIYHVQSSMF